MCKSMHANRLFISINGDIENFESLYDSYILNFSVDLICIRAKATFIAKVYYSIFLNNLFRAKIHIQKF